MFLMISRPTLAVLGVCITVSIVGPAFAAGGGGGTNPAKDCKKGQVWDSNKKKCVKVSSRILPDEELYEQGSALAKAGEYDWALEVLAAIGNQDDPRVLNYTGYSHRKAGRLDTAMGYYQKALAIDPDFVLAREYLGEGYVAAGRTDLARVELAEIEKRCGTTCEAYQDLAADIAATGN